MNGIARKTNSGGIEITIDTDSSSISLNYRDNQ
jgi:hypothetical protein